MVLENANQSSSSSKEERQERRRKRRWGQVKPAEGAAASNGAATSGSAAAPPTDASSSLNAGGTSNNAAASSVDAAKARVLAMQESIRARLAAAKAQQQQQQLPVVANSSSTNTNALKRTAEDALQPSTTVSNQTKRAKKFELDLSMTAPTFSKDDKRPLLRSTQPGEVTTDSTQPPRPPSPTKIVNPYLSHWRKEIKSVQTSAAISEASVDPELAAADDIDDRLERASKPRKRGKAFTFVEPGHWAQVAEQKRLLAAKAEASGYVSGRKTGHTIQSASMAQIYGRGGDDREYGKDVVEGDSDDFQALGPRADVNPDTKMPLMMEWWDMPLLPGKLKKQAAAAEAKALTKQTKAALEHLGGEKSPEQQQKINTTESNSNVSANEGMEGSPAQAEQRDLQKRCFEYAALTYSKTASLVQHIVPVKPPNANLAGSQPPVLHLTKKERKRQRKLRRQEKQRELQDMQAAGLVAAPEPRLTLKNFIQVMGDQAFLDPSQIEQKVMDQMQKRQQAHLERNEANKLTKEQRAEKRARKLREDTSSSVTVALFYVVDMSHPYHRAKVDLNAQQNNISGGVLECLNPPMACVICEGGPKAIKRFRRLMEVRMKWMGPDDEDDDDGDLHTHPDEGEGERVTHKFNPKNKCELVWQGIAVKRLFKGFVFQSCENADQARKVLKQKGVPQYWDQVLDHANGRSNSMQIKLARESDDDDDEDMSEDDSVQEMKNVTKAH